MDYQVLAKQFLKNMHLLHRSRAQKKMRDSMQGEAYLLYFLTCSQGDALPSEISRKMGISSARIAATLNSLESKGFISRRIDPDDRRRILVGLTDAGRVQADQHVDKVIHLTADMLEALGERDAREYVRIIGKLAGIVQQQRDAGPSSEHDSAVTRSETCDAGSSKD